MKKIGIVGAGNMGVLHGKLLSGRKGATLGGVTDLDSARGEKTAEELGCPFFRTADDLFGAGLDMLFITVPNTRHAELAIGGLNAGLDVFVEKPLATCLPDADRVCEAEAKSGKRVFVGYNRRFAPVYAAAREVVANPAFKPANANIIQNDGDMRNPPWLTDVAMTGGFMYDTTVHFLDDVGDAFLERVRSHCAENAVEIANLAFFNSFGFPSREENESELKRAVEWMNVAVKLGSCNFRVFAGWMGGPDREKDFAPQRFQDARQIQHRLSKTGGNPSEGLSPVMSRRRPHRVDAGACP